MTTPIDSYIINRVGDAPVTHGYRETRNGPEHTDFDPINEQTLTPSKNTHYDGPVALLTGQLCGGYTEWFALMMKASPNVTLMGDRTRGASGGPAKSRDRHAFQTAEKRVSPRFSLVFVNELGVFPLGNKVGNKGQPPISEIGNKGQPPISGLFPVGQDLFNAEAQEARNVAGVHHLTILYSHAYVRLSCVPALG